MKHPQPPKVEGDQFFKVKDEKIQYWGNRWFRYNIENDRVVTVALIPGEADISKGKNVCMGIYTIGRLTFMSNYYAFNKLDSVSKEEYGKAFEEAIKILK